MNRIEAADTMSYSKAGYRVETDSTALVPGGRLGRYELLAPLAEGGMAAVWLGRARGELGFERLVAIKTIRADHSVNDRYRAMFLDELRLAAAIRHPNVVDMLDVGIAGDRMYLVMEYVEGDSLSAFLRELGESGERVPLPVALRFAMQLCAGLHAAHELRGSDGKPLGVVHRDVSPQNALVDAYGRLKLIDFGIAKASQRLAPATEAGSIRGKVSYMSPEQARSEELDRRTDVWAIGVTLYLMVTGRLPIRAPNTLAMVGRLASGQLDIEWHDVPFQLLPIVRRCLAPNREDRFATAAELERELERASRMVEAISSAELARFVARVLRPRLEQRAFLVEHAQTTAGTRERVMQVLSSAPHRAPAVRSIMTTLPDLPQPRVTVAEHTPVLGDEETTRKELPPWLRDAADWRQSQPEFANGSDRTELSPVGPPRVTPPPLPPAVLVVSAATTLRRPKAPTKTATRWSAREFTLGAVGAGLAAAAALFLLGTDPTEPSQWLARPPVHTQVERQATAAPAVTPSSSPTTLSLAAAAVQAPAGSAQAEVAPAELAQARTIVAEPAASSPKLAVAKPIKRAPPRAYQWWKPLPSFLKPKATPKAAVAQQPMAPASTAGRSPVQPGKPEQAALARLKNARNKGSMLAALGG